MSTNEDGSDARRDALEEGRRRVGPPPDFETVDALLRGGLPPEEAQRVRETLAYYPELVHIMTAEGSETTALLTDEQEAADVAKIRRRIGLDASQQPNRFRLFAIAAGVVIAVVIAGVVVTRMDRRDPRPVVSRILTADAQRSPRGAPSTREILLSSSTDYELKPLHTPRRSFESYRLELHDLNADPPRIVWLRDGLQRQRDGSFPVTLSTEELNPGRYALVLYGMADAPEELATYTLRIE